MHGDSRGAIECLQPFYPFQMSFKPSTEMVSLTISGWGALEWSRLQKVVILCRKDIIASKHRVKMWSLSGGLQHTLTCLTEKPTQSCAHVQLSIQ